MKILPAVITAVVVGIYIFWVAHSVFSGIIAALTIGAIVFGATNRRNPPLR
ncbi:MAG: hypothetical protein KA152_06980 [Verrucomicrobiales bacterium]|nr:hypothetical protein [Verrucomicrobiales bacterium]HQW29733.1 hypothetical protein [Verrucomicrobiales bacterium]